MKRQTKITTAAAFLLFGLILGKGPAASAAETISLQPKFTKGQVFRVVMTIDMNMSMEASRGALNRSMKATMDQVLEMVLRVLDVDAQGNITLQLTYDRFKQSADMGGMKYTFDSREEKPDEKDRRAQQFLRIVKPLIGHVIIITMDRNLRATRVTGLDTLWEEIGKGSGGAAGVRMMKSMLGDEQLKKMIDNFGWQDMPREPVTVGKSWTSDKKLQIPIIGPMQLTSTSTLVGIEDHDGRRCAKITMTANLESTGSRPASLPAAMERMKLESCEMKGVSWFDLRLHQIRDIQLDQDLHMMIHPRPRRAESQPTSLPTMNQRMKSKIRITVTPEPTTRPQ